MARKNWNNEVYWVCTQCGNLTYIVTAALDKKYPLGGVPKVPTYHTGKCEACGKDNIPVTEARDFGYPNFNLINWAEVQKANSSSQSKQSS